jgi:hypothetical protein
MVPLWLLAACVTAEAPSGTSVATGSGASASTSTAGAGGTNGAGGDDGGGGTGGGSDAPALPDDPEVCGVVEAMSTPLIAGAAEDSATTVPKPDTWYAVTLPSTEGYLTYDEATSHADFLLVAEGATSLVLSTQSLKLPKKGKLVGCEGKTYLKIFHHSHDPATFMVTLSAQAGVVPRFLYRVK